VLLFTGLSTSLFQFSPVVEQLLNSLTKNYNSLPQLQITKTPTTTEPADLERVVQILGDQHRSIAALGSSKQLAMLEGAASTSHDFLQVFD
jgi:hypothetical protein